MEEGEHPDTAAAARGIQTPHHHDGTLLLCFICLLLR